MLPSFLLTTSQHHQSFLKIVKQSLYSSARIQAFSPASLCFASNERNTRWRPRFALRHTEQGEGLSFGTYVRTYVGSSA